MVQALGLHTALGTADGHPAVARRGAQVAAAVGLAAPAEGEDVRRPRIDECATLNGERGRGGLGTALAAGVATPRAAGLTGTRLRPHVTPQTPPARQRASCPCRSLLLARDGGVPILGRLHGRGGSVQGGACGAANQCTFGSVREGYAGAWCHSAAARRRCIARAAQQRVASSLKDIQTTC